VDNFNGNFQEQLTSTNDLRSMFRTLATSLFKRWWILALGLFQLRQPARGFFLRLAFHPTQVLAFLPNSQNIRWIRFEPAKEPENGIELFVIRTPDSSPQALLLSALPFFAFCFTQSDQLQFTFGNLAPMSWKHSH
jgi:hypothetical protein